MSNGQLDNLPAMELALQALEKASNALEKLGDEDTRGFVRSAIIELKAVIDDPLEFWPEHGADCDNGTCNCPMH